MAEPKQQTASTNASGVHARDDAGDAALASSELSDQRLRGRVRTGAVWMVSVTAASRVLSFGSQLALAAILLEEDFGVAAMAIGAGGLLQTFRDGGISRLLIQQGVEGYERLSGQYFWLALAVNTSLAALVFAAAPFLATHVYEQPRVTTLMWILALYAPLSTPGQILGSKLRIDLRFRISARIVLSTRIIQYVGVVIFALLGFGAMSFVLPYPLMAAWRSIATYAATRDKPWRRPPEVRLWPGTLRRTFWPMSGTLGTFLSNQGDYMVLGAVATAGVTGIYFFSYQLAKQVVAPLAVNVGGVLFPALARIRHDAARQRDLSIRIMGVLSALSAPMAWGVITIIGPFMALLFEPRWAPAILTIQALSVAMPALLLQHIPHTVLMSTGKFRLWAILIILDGVGLMTAAVVGGLLVSDAGLTAFAGETYDAFGVAVVVGVFSIFSSLVISHIGLRTIGAGARTALRCLLPPTLVGVGSAAVAIVLSEICFAAGDELSRLIWRSAFFGFVAMILARRLIPSETRALIGLAPGPILRVAEGVIRLRRVRLRPAAQPSSPRAPRSEPEVAASDGLMD
jgi:PST family polysaccharide transporter